MLPFAYISHAGSIYGQIKMNGSLLWIMIILLLLVMILVREFLEIDDLETFRRVAEHSPLVIRRDPFLFAQFFSMMFFINVTRMKSEDLRRLFGMLKGKTIVVKGIVEASSIGEFIKKMDKGRLKEQPQNAPR